MLVHYGPAVVELFTLVLTALFFTIVVRLGRRVEPPLAVGVSWLGEAVSFKYGKSGSLAECVVRARVGFFVWGVVFIGIDHAKRLTNEKCACV